MMGRVVTIVLGWGGVEGGGRGGNCRTVEELLPEFFWFAEKKITVLHSLPPQYVVSNKCIQK